MGAGVHVAGVGGRAGGRLADQVQRVGGGSQSVEVGGRTIAFERAGSGPPLLLLHGVLGDSREWRPQLESLAGDFDVVAWDAPGCGASDDAPSPCSLADFADLAAGFVAALGLERPHVVGLSFGGGLAIELFRRHPELPRSLVLASAYAGWAGSLPPEVVEERRALALRDADRPAEDVARDFGATLFDETTPQVVVDEVMTVMREARPATLATMGAAFADADLRDVLPAIDVPVLLVYGDRDRRASLEVAEDMHARIPGSKLAVVHGAGHIVNVEAPERFDDELRGFLRG